MNTLTRENVEMPVKIGLGCYLKKDGTVWTGNRANVEKLAERFARRQTTIDGFLWNYSVFQTVSYFRISFCGQKTN